MTTTLKASGVSLILLHHSLLKPDSLPLRPIPNRPYTIVMDKLKDMAGKVTGKSGGESGGSSSGAGAGGKQEQYIDKGASKHDTVTGL